MYIRLKIFELPLPRVPNQSERDGSGRFLAWPYTLWFSLPPNLSADLKLAFDPLGLAWLFSVLLDGTTLIEGRSELFCPICQLLARSIRVVGDLDDRPSAYFLSRVHIFRSREWKAALDGTAELMSYVQWNSCGFWEKHYSIESFFPIQGFLPLHQLAMIRCTVLFQTQQSDLNHVLLIIAKPKSFQQYRYQFH